MADDAPLAPPSSSAVSFTIEGKWAHFRRIDTTTVKQSYRVIPPTTAMGLIAAMLGYERDSYYQRFSKENAAFAISVERPVEPFQLAKLELSTTENDFESGRSKGVLRNLVARKTTAGDRQQRLYEYLRDPAYKIILAVDDDETHDDLVGRLENHDYVYTPSLGRTECVGYISDWQEHDIEETTADQVDSTAPLDVVRPTSEVSVERTAQRFSATEHSRQPTSFVSYGFSKTGDSIPVLSGTEAYSVGDDTVLFV